MWPEQEPNVFENRKSQTLLPDWTGLWSENRRNYGIFFLLSLMATQEVSLQCIDWPSRIRAELHEPINGCDSSGPAGNLTSNHSFSPPLPSPPAFCISHCLYWYKGSEWRQWFGHMMFKSKHTFVKERANLLREMWLFREADGVEGVGGQGQMSEFSLMLIRIQHLDKSETFLSH